MELFPKLKRKLQSTTKSYNATPLSNALLGISSPTTRSTPRNNLTFANNTMYNNGTAVGSAVTGNTRTVSPVPTVSTPRVVNTTPTVPNYQTPAPVPQAPQSPQAPQLTGNFILDQYDNPDMFAQTNYQDQVDRYNTMIGPYYDQLIKYNQDQFSNTLEGQQNDFNNYLAQSEANLASDRNKLDVDSGKNNYAFSEGIRNNQRGKLQDSYNRDINGKRQQLQTSIANQAGQLEYQIGEGNMNNFNFNLANGTANAMSNTPSLVRSTNRVYTPRGYTGTLNDERNFNAQEMAYPAYGYGLTRNNRGLSQAL
jgi:hypothetical protein